MSSKKIAITGASGFLGSHLVKRMKDDGQFHVFALSSRPEELKEKTGGSNVVYLHKDRFLQDGSFLNDAVVVNCAYPRNSAGTAVADGLKYIQHVFEAAADNKSAAIINISSQSVYSQQRTETASEETEICLESPYAVGKYASELLLESICRGKGLKQTNLRMASLIGPGFDQRIVNRFVKQACEGQALNISISDQRFGFLDVEDAVSAIIALIDNTDIPWQPAYNVGNAKAYSITEIAESVKKVFEDTGLNFPGINTAAGEKTGNTAVDYHKISEDTGFKPECALEETIGRILRTLRN